MTGLETAFYIIGIVFMSLMLLLMVVGVVAILVIRSKVVALHKSIDEKLSGFHDWAGRGEAVLGAIKKVAKK
jgi:cell division protein FtsL